MYLYCIAHRLEHVLVVWQYGILLVMVSINDQYCDANSFFRRLKEITNVQYPTMVLFHGCCGCPVNVHVYCTEFFS